MLHFSISIYVPISSLIYHYYSTIFLSHFSLQLLLILISVVPKFFYFSIQPSYYFFSSLLVLVLTLNNISAIFIFIRIVL